MIVWWRLVFVFKCFVHIPREEGSSQQTGIMTSWIGIIDDLNVKHTFSIRSLDMTEHEVLFSIQVFCPIMT